MRIQLLKNEHGKEYVNKTWDNIDSATKWLKKNELVLVYASQQEIFFTKDDELYRIEMDAPLTEVLSFLRQNKQERLYGEYEILLD